MIVQRMVLFYKFGLDLCGLEELHIEIVDLFHLSFDIDFIRQGQELLFLHDFLIELNGLLFEVVFFHSVVAYRLVLAGPFEVFEIVAVFGFDFLWKFDFDFALLFHLSDQLMELFQVVFSDFMAVFGFD